MIFFTYAYILLKIFFTTDDFNIPGKLFHFLMTCHHFQLSAKVIFTYFSIWVFHRFESYKLSSCLWRKSSCIWKGMILTGASQVKKLPSGKEPACQCRRCKRCGFHLWVGKIPGGGHGNWLPYSCLENPMNRGAWTWLKWLSTHAYNFDSPVFTELWLCSRHNPKVWELISKQKDKKCRWNN